jgi:hypothetical protein
MYIITLGEFAFTAIFIGYMIYTYSNKHVSAVVKISVFVTNMLSIGLVLMLPLDVYITRRNKQNGTDL